MWADPDFIQTYQIELARGSFFTSAVLEGHRAVVLNESAVNSLEIENPLGQKLIDMDGKEFTIIGVVKDFHYDSLHKPIKSMLIHPYGPDIGFGRYLSVRIATDNVRECKWISVRGWREYSNSPPLAKNSSGVTPKAPFTCG